jgi:lipoprotein-anchoring transpeptidase ErfK/SrfK
MGLDYPSDRDFSDGRTGTAIIIHSNERIDAVGLGAYKGTAGCVGMYTRDSRLVYLAVEPGSPVIISP